MKARVRLIDGVAFLGESESGHAYAMDGAPDAGGRNLGMRPMEMVLVGMGGCTAFDVLTILRKGRHDVRDVDVQLEAARADQPPKIFTQIHLRFTIVGKELNRDVVQRAINLSAEKYCSASIMLGKSAAITHEFQIVDVS